MLSNDSGLGGGDELELCPLPGGEGGPRPAVSPVGAGRAFARRRVMNAKGTQPVTAHRRVGGPLHGDLESSNP
jgi:hypothetical protein